MMDSSLISVKIFRTDNFKRSFKNFCCQNVKITLKLQTLYLQEALRLFPSVPLLGRELTEECKFGKEMVCAVIGEPSKNGSTDYRATSICRKIVKSFFASIDRRGKFFGRMDVTSKYFRL